ncbi:MAG: nicotinate-nucleotide adenylyltransferase [Lactobacillaceae bacterium]|nr:nicotinate-nucleotide adenylyltransferase [Lactobacillaceae bacterium]
MTNLRSRNSTTVLSFVEFKKQEILRNPQRIGLFGGTFNPIHNGQLIAAEQVARNLKLDKIIFIPNSIPFGATHQDAIDPSYRAEMVRLAIANNSLFDINTTELFKGGKTSTYETVKELKSINPQNEYFVILGAHLIKDLPNWENAVELSKISQIVGIKEPNNDTPDILNTKWIFINYLDISSSDIRSLLRLRRSVRYLVPDVVAMYIAEYGLYQGRY